MKIWHSTEYFDIFLDPQVLEIYRLSSQERAEHESKSTFDKLNPGSIDTLKIVNSKYFYFNEDLAFNRIFRYFPVSSSAPNL